MIDEPAVDGPAVCAMCGAEPTDGAATLALTWSREVSARGVRWICADCTRRNARSIEAKLDLEWW